MFMIFEIFRFKIVKFNCLLGRLYNFDDKIFFYVGYYVIVIRYNRFDEEEDIMEFESG